MEDTIVIDGINVELSWLESVSFNEHRGKYGTFVATSYGCDCCSHEYENLSAAQVKIIASALAERYAQIAERYRKLAERIVA